MDPSDAIDLDFDDEPSEGICAEAPTAPPDKSEKARQTIIAPLAATKEKPRRRKIVGESTEVSAAEMQNLYEDMSVSGSESVLRTVLAKGVDGMTAFDLEKVFAEFHPYRVEILEDASAIVHFSSRMAAAAMMLHMCKRLRRVRGAKRVEEEGEILESSEEEEEEGVLKEEHGDDVEIIDKGADHKPKKTRNQFVQIDVDVVRIPDGKWRVVTEHVPDRRLLIVRFATRDELEAARKKRIDGGDIRKRKADEFDDEGYQYSWTTEEKVRPGLNVFTEEGKELDWDYEHDTRFYEDSKGPIQENEDKEIKDWGKDAPPPTKKVRGRGAVRAHLLTTTGADTMRADTEKKVPPSNRLRSDHDEYVDSEEEESDAPEPSWSRGDELPPRPRRMPERSRPPLYDRVSFPRYH